MNSNSGGPSSWSSGDCSTPIWLRSQILMRLSLDADANTVGLCGDHASESTSSACDSNTWSFLWGDLVSCKITVCEIKLQYECSVWPKHTFTLSELPVTIKWSTAGQNDNANISASCACIWLVGLAGARESHLAHKFIIRSCVNQITHIMSMRSSPTLPKMFSLVGCQSTSCLKVLAVSCVTQYGNIPQRRIYDHCTQTRVQLLL